VLAVTTTRLLSEELKSELILYKNPSKHEGKFYRNHYWKSLFECACVDGQFNRKTSNRRANIEKTLLKKVSAQFNPSTPIFYLSLGSGGLLQDYFICHALLLRGYHLKIFLIEPENKTESIQKAHAQFIKDLKDVVTSVHSYSSIQDYFKNHPNTKIHIATAIDFTFPHKSFEDLVLTHQALETQGYFYIAIEKQDFLLQKKYCELAKNIYSSNFIKSLKEWWESPEPESHAITKIPRINTVGSSAWRGEVILKTMPGIGGEANIVKTILGYAGFFRPEILRTKEEIVQPRPNGEMMC